ncbi:MAG TPA: hypothetical protein PK079_10570 [Leptospiraceae bacterium]|nr:hypothetical protein [Leptospiraceae bacterium]HMX32701.1 hypothetical protein [Leptospiraceae bacterium]HMY32711.1 hypothetical protein [Leptospiraceae bacterium]HMZ62519.1 hypothetical protein [Leptospiraceae bacterium]HNA05751.1 hypothetical protein [Leptospiraceae bacterium]
MRTDTEIRLEGMKILFSNMDIVEAEKFISIIQRDKFDYTKWRQKLYEGLSVRELSKKAMHLRENKEK